MRDSRLQGKTALITGAAKRIGRETALVLADEGVNVVVHYNTSSTEADELVRELTAKEVRAWAIQADFGKPEGYEGLIERAVEAGGALDILINNASIFPKEKLDELTFRSLMTNIEINAWAPFVLAKEFQRLVGRGKIINLHDTRVTGYDWVHTGYILSKHVLSAMTRMLAVDFAPDITVNAVAPGLILPPPGQDDSYLERLKTTVPLQRYGAPEDIAEAIVFLLRSDFITGEVIYVDGGRHLKENTNG